MKKGLFIGCLLFTLTTYVNSQSLYELLADTIDVVVAPDESGDFTSLMAAIEASSGNEVIFVKNGVYNEKVEIDSDKEFLTIIGEDVDSVIITYNDYSGSGELYNGIMTGRIGDEIGTSTSHTFMVMAENVTLMNLTIVNNAGEVGQAVALNLNRDKIILAHCRVMGYQDTFYTWGTGRFLLKDCFMEGAVDFMFGRGAAIYDSCVINTNRDGAPITAASTDPAWQFGYVFQNCYVTANRGVTGVPMGRPWKAGARTVFMNSYLDKHIASSGWNDWDNRGTNGDCYYAEYNNYGPGATTSGRVSWSHQLGDILASVYTMENIFDTENATGLSGEWVPNLYQNKLYRIVRSNTELLYNENFNSAYIMSIKYNDIPVPDFTPGSKTYTIVLPADTEEIPTLSIEPHSPKASIDTIVYPETLPGDVTIKMLSGNKGVSMTYTVKFTLATDISETNADNKAQLLTNIIGDYLTITSENISSEILLNVYTLSGQKVMTKSFYATNEETQFSTTHLSDGVYFYSIQFNNQLISGKLIKTL